MHELEQFHYGQLVHHGSPTGEMRVLAKSPGIRDRHINEALKNTLLPPLEQTCGVAWGVLRAGRGKAAYLTRTDHDADSGAVIRQFVEIPVAVLKALAGNVQALRTLVEKPLPVYEMLGDTLPRLQLPDDPAPADDDQIDGLLDLLTYAKNNTRNMEPLLAAIVSGTPLVVRQAPAKARPRAGFVQGLLALLPASTRFGVSFLLHNTPDSGCQANIEFMTTPPERDALIYNWDSGDISGADVSSDYSRFIVGQMRLDTSLVLQQTDRLTRTAGWRFSSGDSLQEALDYASYRSRIDRSVENNMPVDVASVAQILEDDPTLDDDTRVRYARHLMSFALALEEMEHVEQVAVTMHGNPTLQDDVYSRLQDAIDSGKGALIFETLVSWLNNPLAPQGPRWMQLLRTAALAELDNLLDANDIRGINAFLRQINSLDESAQPLAAPVLNRLLPRIGKNKELAALLLLLSVRHLSDDRLHKLLNSQRFLKAQPRPLRRYLLVLKNPERTPPDGTLVRAANVYAPQFYDEALLHLALFANQNDRLSLIDRRVLRDLVTLLSDHQLPLNADKLAQLAINLNQTRLTTLKDPAPRFILQILLMTGRYQWLSQAMIAQSRDYYGTNRPFDYVRSIQSAFKERALSASDARRALDELEQHRIRDVPFLGAICGALEAADWSTELESYASRLMQELAGSPRYMQMLPIQAAFAVLRYYARQDDRRKLHMAVRVIASTCAHKEGRLGLSAANRAYAMLKRHPRTRPVALEVIRQYVREADDRAARHMMNYYKQQLDDDSVSQKLQIAYEFSNMMGRLDLVTYAGLLRDTVESLQHLAESYHQAGRYPQLIQLRGLVDRIRRSAPSVEFHAMGADLRQVAHDLVILGEQHNRRSKTDEQHIAAMVTASDEPQSILDVMRVAGGHLTDKSVYGFSLSEKDDISKPFGNLAPDRHPARVAAMKQILHAATTSRPTSRHVWTGEAIADEINSRVKSLPGIGLNDLLAQTGRDWQRLADLITHLVEHSDTDVIKSDNRTGRKLDNHAIQPQSPLALLRFIYGATSA
jgi:hypothetical protein